ncbi:hypothetical protein P9112_005986 [Eukaryota sp. TZLM1-RC]
MSSSPAHVSTKSHKNLPASLTLVGEHLVIEYSNGLRKSIHIPSSQYKLLTKTTSVPNRFPFSLGDVTVYCDSASDRLQWIAHFEQLHRLKKPVEPTPPPIDRPSDPLDRITIIITNKTSGRKHTLYFSKTQYYKLTIQQLRSHVNLVTHIAIEDQELYVDGKLIDKSEGETLMKNMLPSGGNVLVEQGNNTISLEPPEEVPNTIDLISKGEESEGSEGLTTTTTTTGRVSDFASVSAQNGDDDSSSDESDENSGTVAFTKHEAIGEKVELPDFVKLAKEGEKPKTVVSEWLASGSSRRRKSTSSLRLTTSPSQSGESSRPSPKNSGEAKHSCGVCNGAVVQEMRRIQSTLTQSRQQVTDLVTFVDSLVGELAVLGVDASSRPDLVKLASKSGYSLPRGSNIESEYNRFRS